jgi:hypothetical protein
MSIFEEWTVLSSVWLRGMDLLIFMGWFGDSVQWDGELETDTVGHFFCGPHMWNNLIYLFFLLPSARRRSCPLTLHGRSSSFQYHSIAWPCLDGAWLSTSTRPSAAWPCLVLALRRLLSSRAQLMRAPPRAPTMLATTAVCSSWAQETTVCATTLLDLKQ